MRSKLAIGGLTVAVAFLIATNPVVVDAAGQITGKQIKNNSVTTKDIKNNNLKGGDVKNGSLTSADLAAGTIPAPSVKSVKRIQADLNDQPLPIAAAIYTVGPTVAITVDANDTVDASATINIDNATDGDQFDAAMCVIPQGTVTPVPLGGTDALFESVDLHAGDNPVTFHGIAQLPAGTHSIGLCLNMVTNPTTAEDVIGSVVVYDSSGPLTRASDRGAKGSDD